MPHLATLNEYHFKNNADDVRGSELYGEGHQKLGRIRDVVFDHATGDVRYLVVGNEFNRRVLVPLNRVFLAAAYGNAFTSVLKRDDLDHLPAFDDKLLKHDRQWRSYEKLYQSVLPERSRVETGNPPAVQEQRSKVTPFHGGRGRRWNNFAAHIKHDLRRIRGKCERCQEKDFRAA